MAAAFEEAQAQSDAAKAAALAALARGGSQALAEYQDSQSQLAAMRQQAAQAAAQRAAAIGAQGAGAELAAGGHLAGTAEAAGGRSASSIYDTYSQDQARAGSARQQALADMAGQNSQYFSQVDAARPIMENRAKAAWDAKEAARVLAEQRAAQAELDRQEARERAAQAQAWREEDRAWKLEDRALTRQEKAEKAAGLRSGAGLSDSALAKRLRGASDVAVATGNKKKQPKSIMGFKIPQMSQTERARRIGVEAGIDPNRVFGILQPPKPKAGAKAPSASSILSNQNAQAELNARAAREAVHAAAKRAAHPKTFFEFEQTLKAAGDPNSDWAGDPLGYINHLSDDYLRRNSISREALADWVNRYLAI